MIAACYSMDLYCRNNIPNRGESVDARKPHHNEPAQYTGRTFAECKREAQAAGWLFSRDGDVTCPKCQPKPHTRRTK